MKTLLIAALLTTAAPEAYAQEDFIPFPMGGSQPAPYTFQPAAPLSTYQPPAYNTPAPAMNQYQPRDNHYQPVNSGADADMNHYHPRDNHYMPNDQD
jgi:hypothetical protein